MRETILKQQPVGIFRVENYFEGSEKKHLKEITNESFSILHLI